MDPEGLSRRAFVVGAAALLPSLAAARPVPTGRLVRLPYGVSTEHPWRMGGGDARRSHASPFRAPATAPRRRWEARVGSGRTYAPVLTRDGVLFVASQSGLAAVGADGHVRWMLRLGLASGTPGLTPTGDLALGVPPSAVVVVGASARTMGEPPIRVRAELGGGVRGSPLVLDDGSIVVAAHDHAVHRLDPDGRPIFRAAIATQVRGTVTLAGDRLVVPAGRGAVFLDLDGILRGRADVGAEVALDAAAVRDGSVWLAASDGTLTRVSERGSRVASTGLAPSLASNLAIAPDGGLRFGSRADGLVAITADGSVGWQTGAALSVTGGVTVDADGCALAFDSSAQTPHLVAVDADGSVRWRVEVARRGDAPPVLGPDGTIYLATYGGTLDAWGPAEG